MMAETYRQTADGSNNPTGEAQPQEGPQVYTGVPTAARASSKQVKAGQAETKVVEPDDAENKTAKKTASKGAKKKG